MQDNIEIGAVVIALTELVKTWGVPSKLCPTVAVLFGIVFTLGSKIVNGTYTQEQIYGAVLHGIVVGVTSTGLYRAGKNFSKPKSEEIPALMDEETY